MNLRVVGRMESWRGLGRRGRAAVSRRTPARRTPADPAGPGVPPPRQEARDETISSGTGVGGAGTGSGVVMRGDAAAPRASQRNDPAEPNDAGKAAASAGRNDPAERNDAGEAGASVGRNGPGQPTGPGDTNGPGDLGGPGEAPGAVVASGNGSIVMAGDRTGTVVVAAERTAGRANSPEQSRVPSWLQTAAAWSWRLLLIAIVIYLTARMLGILYIVVVPCVAALLLTALVQPLTSRLRRAGLPAMLATWVTLLIAAIVLGGLVTLVANRVSADYPTLLAETRHTTAQVQSWLAGPPFHVKNSNIQRFLNDIPSYLSKHKT